MTSAAEAPAAAASAADNTRAEALIAVIDRNTLVWWAVLLASVALYGFVGPAGGAFWVAALAVDDLSFWLLGRPLLFDSTLRVRRGYQWIHNLYDGTAGAGRDLGFNLVTPEGLSQKAKYESMARSLGLRPGMAVCDVGCGYGDWLRWCRDELGCEAVGVNLTPEQAAYARERYGLEVHATDWKRILADPELQARLYGRFDAVTFMDTVEHYVGMEDRRDPAKQRAVYAGMCELAARLLKPDSASGRVFISLLHQARRPRTWRFYAHSYLMDKMYSGHYPFVGEGPVAECRPWFDVVSVEDRTEDYRLTGVRDRRHFQAVALTPTPRKAAYVAAAAALDPFVLHRLAYYLFDSWMWFYGEDPYSPDYDAERRRRVSWVALHWITLERRKDAP